MPPRKLTNEIINAAVLGFEQQKNQIDAKIAELRAMLPGGSAGTTATPEAPTRKRKKFSAAARRRIQRRWAKIRGESEPQVAPPQPAKAKRKISSAAKAKLVANLKKARAAKAAKAKKAAKESAPARKKAAVKRAAVKAPTAEEVGSRFAPAH